MKKALAFLSLAVLALSSCQTVVNTARTVDAQSDIKSITVADLKVADKRVTATIDPVSKDLRKGGEKNVRQAVEAKALEMAGDADVLLEPRYVVTKKSGLFTGKKITSISVSGRPAWYENFRTLDDSVWSNAAFRGIAPVYGEKFKKTSISPYGVAASGFNNQKEIAFRHRGWRAYCDLFVGGGNSEIGKDKRDVSISGLFTASLGYQFGPYFYLGLGSGFGMNKLKNVDTPCNYVPIFYDLRFNASRSVNTWYLNLKFGAGMPVGNYVDHLDKVKQPIFVSPSIGYNMGNLSIGIYAIHNEFEGKYKYYYYYGSSSKSKIDYNFTTWGVNLGVRF